jgi:hypothetical protein
VRLFIGDLKNRLANRVQLTTDGWHAYLDAVENDIVALVEASEPKPGKRGPYKKQVAA